MVNNLLEKLEPGLLDELKEQVKNVAAESKALAISKLNLLEVEDVLKIKPSQNHRSVWPYLPPTPLFHASTELGKQSSHCRLRGNRQVLVSQ